MPPPQLLRVAYNPFSVLILFFLPTSYYFFLKG
uniref:Uncharacterized protein n=1 Tax=Anguilla anguilla TaxID=7936 RepID=A0A0E9WQ08_ANGAN